MEKKSCSDDPENQAASSLWVASISYSDNFVCVKTHMGLQPFEVRFFSGDKFSKINLALSEVIKNRPKVGYGESIVF